MHWYKFAHLSKIILNNLYLFLHNHRNLNIITMGCRYLSNVFNLVLNLRTSSLAAWTSFCCVSKYDICVCETLEHNISCSDGESVWILRILNTEEQRAHTLRAEQSISFSLISFRKLSRSRLCLSMESFKLSTIFCLSRKSRSTNWPDRWSI